MSSGAPAPHPADSPYPGRPAEPGPPELPLHRDEPFRPVRESERYDSLDVVRGIAVLGILLVNIEDFALVESARYVWHANTAPGTWGRAIWFATMLLADTKFIAIFTMLFGVSIALVMQKAGTEGGGRLGIYYRRMFALLGIGAAHHLLFWDGDILYDYAALALLIPWAPRLPSAVLLAVAAGCLAVETLFFAGLATDPSVYVDSRPVSLYEGPWIDFFQFRVQESLFHFIGIPMLFLFQGIGHMFAGMLLLRWGVVQGALRAGRYALLGIVAGAVGAGAVTWSLHAGIPFASSTHAAAFVWGSLSLSIAYICAGAALSLAAATTMVVKALRCAGRMALTNYLFQTMICTTLFYGHGFGLFEQLSRLELLGVVAAIWVAELAGSVWWLRRFRFGPAEWAWRCVTYLRVQPFRRDIAESV